MMLVVALAAGCSSQKEGEAASEKAPANVASESNAKGASAASAAEAAKDSAADKAADSQATSSANDDVDINNSDFRSGAKTTLSFSMMGDSARRLSGCIAIAPICTWTTRWR